MAIARGVGTEIIRTAMFEDCDGSTLKLIQGEQHHIYTVLSIVICCASIQANGNQININLQGYDLSFPTEQPPISFNAICFIMTSFPFSVCSK